ncbi:MAG: ATP-binding protein [Nitrospirae bacterium]|nr:MAG: ATP-binding protein [Nitrospirota bacterium]
MFQSENLQKKWAPVLDHPDLPTIKDPYRKAITAVLLENQEIANRTMGRILQEDSPTNSAGSGGFGGGSTATGPVAGIDPIMISMVRRSLPNLLAYDVCGVQPMTGPTGLIFAMRSRYTNQSGTEAFYNEADTDFSGAGTHSGSMTMAADTSTGNGNVFVYTATTGTAAATATGEALGTSGGGSFGEMAVSIEKVTVTAKTRALKAEYSMELAQDLKAVHGLDAESELANMLSAEVLAEINREVLRTIYSVAKVGCQVGTTTSGTFDLDTDSNGRWMVEKIKGLAFQLEREANTIAKQTRRGKGNVIICSSDVASAFAMAGLLDYGTSMKDAVALNVDDTGSTFAGSLFGRLKVYIDPYFATSATSEFAVVGYKGTNAYDAGIFYCPYVPLQMVRAVDTGSFQPKIGFKTRYGLTANPFAEGTTQGVGAMTARANVYYRALKISNIV